MIYFISDTHFGHEKILEYGERNFSSVAEMNNVIISNYNRTISSDDTVYFVGDFCLGSLDAIRENLKLFKKSKELILVKGNHDRIANDEEARSVGFSRMVNKLVLQVDELRIGVSHYPFRPQGEMSGKYNLKPEECDLLIHGHVHQRFGVKTHESGKMMFNVSVEVINYTPINLEEILAKYRAG